MSDIVSAADRAKHAAAARALELVGDGMKLGLGTGSTAKVFVDLLAERVRAEGLALTCVATSRRTAAQAEALGLNVVSLDRAGALDLTIDGADEFDEELNLIKGGGGALLVEKIVAAASQRMVVIADPSKEAVTLGRYPLPVEIVRFGAGATMRLIGRLIEGQDVDGRTMTLREGKDGAYRTDEGHYIVDLKLGRIGDPGGLDVALNAIPGVVETGLFVGLCSAVIVGEPDGDAFLVGDPDRRRG
ncbi:MAG TPA: ribose-5-phosphate isomerase RpiA [Thermohalobaculum sp.]|nr:ribose-5-phosphate isomerase RpiA [Thermohalobaculum sp.]